MHRLCGYRQPVSFSSISEGLIQLSEDVKLHFVWFTQKYLLLGYAAL